MARKTEGSFQKKRKKVNYRGLEIILSMKKSVRGIIIQNKKLLTIKRIKNNYTYWTLPGGDVEDGENDTNALKRELK